MDLPRRRVEITNDQPGRVEVTVGPTRAGAVVQLGEVQVAVTVPSTSALRQLGQEQARASVIRQVRRALEVALEEL